MSDEGARGRLFVVSTPIGNLGDITYRAVETLRQVAVILAEDTRHSRHLLDRYDVRTPVESYHEHNEAKMTPRVLARLASGEDVALISDAGTPLLSDPGSRLVHAAVMDGAAVVPVPGASALLAALVAAGIEAERFTFFGFLPRKGRERAAALEALARLPHAGVLYEAPGRVADTLAELAAAAPDRPAAVARELTKQFEEVRRGTVADLAAYYEDASPRGEVVIVVGAAAPAAPEESVLRARATELRATGASARDVAAALVQEFAVPRNLAYRLAQNTP